MNTAKQGLTLYMRSKTMTPFETHSSAALLSLVGDNINNQPPIQQTILRSHAKKFLWLYLHFNLDRLLNALGKEKSHDN
jgi:hypothetical protein